MTRRNPDRAFGPLGVSPDQQIRRLVVAAQAQGKTQFAALLPDSDFGRDGRGWAAALGKATAAEGPATAERQDAPRRDGGYHFGHTRLSRLRQPTRTN